MSNEDHDGNAKVIEQHGDDRDRVSGGIVVPREGNPMLLCVKSYDSLLGIACFKATPADLTAAIKAMPSDQRTMLIVDVAEDSSALGLLRAQLAEATAKLEAAEPELER